MGGLLTFFAVFPLPARQTGQLAVPGAGVVAEPVVPGGALLGAAFSVVAVVADEAVRKAQLGLLLGLRVRRPLAPDTHLPLDGEQADQEVGVVVVLWRRGGGGEIRKSECT